MVWKAFTGITLSIIMSFSGIARHTAQRVNNRSFSRKIAMRFLSYTFPRLSLLLCMPECSPTT